MTTHAHLIQRRTRGPFIPLELLSLDDIRLLLDASPANHPATERLREVAQQKLPELNEAIARAELVRGWLEDAARCRCPTLDDCPLFEEPQLPEFAASHAFGNG